MKYRFNKNLHILNNLLSYFHELGCCEYHADISIQSGVSIIDIQCPVSRISEDEVNSISEALNGGRQHEVEQNYWELAGDFEPRSDLLFTGMMVDEADVNCEQGQLRVTVRRFGG